MDISLHSFILVVGLLVIIFIVIDGIKKMRQAKADPLEEEWLDQDHELPDDEPLQFDHLEIDDEMLTDHFDLQKVQQNLASEQDPTNEFDIAAGQPKSNDVESNSEVNNSIEPTYKEATDLSNELNQSDEAHQQSRQTREEALQESNAKPNFSQAEVIEESAVDKVDEPADDVLRADKQDPVFSVLEDELEEELEADTLTLDRITADKASNARARSNAAVAKKSTASEKNEGLALTEKAKAAAQSFKQHVQELKHNKKAQEEQLLSAQPQTQAKTQTPKRELNSDEPVPMLMEPIELGEEVEPDAPQQQELHLPEFVQQTLSDEAVIKEPEQELRAQKDALLDDYIDDVVSPQDDVGERLSERPPAEEIFVIHVLKNAEPWLQGLDLEHIFKACDMRFGEMNIYHRFEEPNAQGKIQFSVVNAVEPGTFDPQNMSDLSTPGISLFMSLPGPENPMAAFDAMSEVALVFARNFSAQLQDESHSVLTPQTLEHYRQRIRDYTRRNLKK